MSATPGADVLRLGAGFEDAVAALLAGWGLELGVVADGAPIPFSYHGEPEAGLEERRVWVRADTPLHSVLHEACHALCMDGARRGALARDAGGDFRRGKRRLLPADPARRPAARRGRGAAARGHGSLGATRSGSARARRWFESEADDARRWLVQHGLTDDAGRPTGRARA